MRQNCPSKTLPLTLGLCKLNICVYDRNAFNSYREFSIFELNCNDFLLILSKIMKIELFKE